MAAAASVRAPAAAAAAAAQPTAGRAAGETDQRSACAGATNGNLAAAESPPAGPPPRLPPALAACKVEAAARRLPTDLRLALRQLEALRWERDGLMGRLKVAEAQVREWSGPTGA